jgi:4-hydroxy-tetrahydrodipicolinate synthase
LAVAPYQNRPRHKGLYYHFVRVANATTVPLVLSEVSSRTAAHLEPETILRLAEDIPAIRGFTAAHSDLTEAGEVLRHRLASFALWSGDDAFTFPLMALGGDGVVSVASHIVGAAVTDLVRALKYGDLPRARSIQLELLPLFRALFLATNPVTVKAALALIGQSAGPTRAPLPGLTRPQALRLKAALQEVGINIHPEAEG